MQMKDTKFNLEAKPCEPRALIVPNVVAFTKSKKHIMGIRMKNVLALSRTSSLFVKILNCYSKKFTWNKNMARPNISATLNIFL